MHTNAGLVHPNGSLTAVDYTKGLLPGSIIRVTIDVTSADDVTGGVVVNDLLPASLLAMDPNLPIPTTQRLGPGFKASRQAMPRSHGVEPMQYVCCNGECLIYERGTELNVHTDAEKRLTQVYLMQRPSPVKSMVRSAEFERLKISQWIYSEYTIDNIAENATADLVLHVIHTYNEHTEFISDICHTCASSNVCELCCPMRDLTGECTARVGWNHLVVAVCTMVKHSLFLHDIGHH